MVALTDLAPSSRQVRVGGQDVSVYGVSARGLAELLTRFPILKEAFVGEMNLDVDSILLFGPEVVANIIAAGCIDPEMEDAPAIDDEAVKIASRLPVGDQVKFLRPIFELTLPDGPGPLLAALNAFAGAEGESVSLGKAQDSKSPSR